MKRILIVDDDENVREYLRELLTRAGYDVVEATNGREALKVQNASPADLIITDIIMPEKDGVELISLVLEQAPDCKFIAISGGGRISGDFYLDMAKTLNAIATFQKPFDGKALLAAVEKGFSPDVPEISRSV